MLTINIDNHDLEQNIKQTFGDNQSTMIEAFVEFIQQQKVKSDIGISIKQLDNGEGISLKETMNDLRSKYE